MRELKQQALESLMGKVMTDVAGAMGVLMAYIGDQAQVYKALEVAGSCDASELARQSGLDARYLQEWLSANAALGYIQFDSESKLFSLSPEQAAVFAHEGQATCFQGFFEAVISQLASYDVAVDVFKSGEPRPWHKQLPCCFCGTDRFFRPGYAANLISSWLPALDGMNQLLEDGALVADVGCGHGSSTLIMAEHFPHSTFHGFDFHQASIDAAKNKAATLSLPNVKFDTVSATSIPENGYDLICIFDALHDMGDPVGAARAFKQALSSRGRLMIVEPLAGDELSDNLNILGAIFYSFSTTICVPTSKAQDVGLQLGAQAGQKRLMQVLNKAGFNRVERVAQTPTNMVLEAFVQA